MLLLSPWRWKTSTDCATVVPLGICAVSLPCGFTRSCLTLVHCVEPISTVAPAAPKLLPRIVIVLPPARAQLTTASALPLTAAQPMICVRVGAAKLTSETGALNSPCALTVTDCCVPAPAASVQVACTVECSVGAAHS